MPLAARFYSLGVFRFRWLALFVMVVGFFGWLGVAPVQASTGINRQISYQGKLLDSTGASVANGIYQMKFSLYAASAGGTAFWTASGTTALPTAIPVTVQNGLFSIMLGDSSAAGGWQNTFDSIDWNSNAIYLGVTIGIDSEMTPRKRIGAVPQAFNAEQLQGMSASSSVSGNQSLFTIHQTENTSATGTRSALTVRSEGTSDANDYLITGVNDLGSQVFSVNRLGSVTSSGLLAITGAGTSTFNGSLSVQGDTSSTNLYALNGTFGSLNVSSFNPASLSWTNATGTNTTSTNLYAQNATFSSLNLLGAFNPTSLTWTNATGTNTTSTNLYVTNGQITRSTSTNIYTTGLEFGSASGSSETVGTTTVLSQLAANVSSTSPIPLQNSLTLPGTAHRFDVQGRYVYITDLDNDRVQVMDITNPAAPSSTISAVALNSAKNPKGIAVAGKYAYVAYSGTGELGVLDISNATSVREVGTVAGLTGIKEVKVSGSNVYVAYTTGFAIIDVASSTKPRILSTLSIGAAAPTALEIKGGYAYWINNATGYIISILNPLVPVSVGTFPTPSLRYVSVQGRYAYAVSFTDLYITDIADPTNPKVVGRVALPNSANNIRVSGSTAYIATNSTGGVVIVNISNPLSPVVVKTIATSMDALDSYVVGRSLLVLPTDGVSTFELYRLPGIEATTAAIDTLEAGMLQVRADGTITGSLTAGGLVVGRQGIASQGALRVDGGNATSVIQGNLFVGTSTIDSVMHSAFVPDGDDFFVAGNIGSASSVYSNAGLVAGSSNATYYQQGLIQASAGSLALVSPVNTYIRSIETILNGSLILTPSSTAFEASTTVTASSIGTIRVMTTDGAYGYIATNSKFAVANIHTAPGMFIGSGAIPLSYNSSDVAVGNGYAYVSSNTGEVISIIDVRNPKVPVFMATSTLPIGSGPQGLVVQGNRLFVACLDGLRMYDLSNPIAPRLLAFNTDTVALKDVVAHGSYVYAIKDTSTYKISAYSFDPSGTLTQMSSLTATNQPYDIVYQNGYLYYANGLGKVSLVDARNPAVLASVGDTTASSVPVATNALSVNGEYVYMNVGAGVVVYDMFNLSNPTAATQLGTIGSTLSGTVAQVVVGNYLFMGDTGTNTLRAFRVSGAEVNGLTARSALLRQLYVTGDGKVDGEFTVQGAAAVQGALHVTGNFSVSASSTSSTVQFVNNASTSTGTSWGAYINRLLVGNDTSATGTTDYSMVVAYDTGTSMAGLCLRQNGSYCPTITSSSTRYSLVADDAIGANAFDLAELYPTIGEVSSSQVLVFDTTVAGAVKVSGSTPYDTRLAGVVSTRPGFVLGFGEGAKVALAGRVPTQISIENGVVQIGDALTNASTPGFAMKATKAGMILGYALDRAETTSTIDVFVKTGYSAGSILMTDGTVSLVNDDLTMGARHLVTAEAPTSDSWGLTFRGSAWQDGVVQQPSFSLLTEVRSATSSSFVIRNASSSNVFSIDSLGATLMTGDVSVGGKFYPAGRGGVQHSNYLYVDDSSTSTQYIATNAGGWQADDSYDFAERYYSPDRLETGDLVVASDRGQFHVQRSLSDSALLMGIVSTKPAFVAGRPDPDTYPIALAGRVPTKVSNMNGAIKVGDPLAPSSIPGTAVKATKAGPIVGLALEGYSAATVGKIEVFVNPGWWGGPDVKVDEGKETRVESVVASSTIVQAVSFRGFALVTAGMKRVHVAYDSVLSYPNVQVTPRGQVNGGWWTDNYTDVGFDLFLDAEQTRDVTFAWTVQGTVTGTRVYRSDGTYALVNPSTGEAVFQTVTTSTSAEPPMSDTTGTTDIPSSSETVTTSTASLSTDSSSSSTEAESTSSTTVLSETVSTTTTVGE